ncbi:MAG: hypothetical protein AB7O98_03380 [Hyphomonadaceae bacterium]
MIRKFTAVLAAFAFALTTMAPVTAAEARERRGYYDRDYRDHYRGHHRRHRDDDSDALAAGAIGLVLGLALGSLASQPSEPQVRCSNNYQRCPQPYYEDRGYYERGYYEDDGSAYERDYGYAPPPPPRASECTRRERQWDRYANQYVTVDVPC